MDARLIPFARVDEEKFIEIFDGDHTLFSPDIINSIDGNNKYEEERQPTEVH